MDRALLARDIDAIDEYRLIAELGRGGMATVYLACLDGPFGLQKLVVVKVLRHEPSGESPALGQMFLDEARLSAQMRHPNVVQTLEAGQSQDGRLFLVMEYLEGQALSALLRRTSQSHEFWPLAAHVRVLAEMLRGLHYAHELAGLDGTPLGVVHRDVSPQNVFVTYDGAIKLTDFGIAKVTAAESQTQVGVLKGKVAYMAPEQVAGAPLDRRADIFAVGVMLFEALCGKRFWQGQSETAIFRRLLTGRLPDVHEAAPHAPESLRAICARALAVDPAERFETAAGVQHELERWLDTSSRGATPAQVGRVAATLFRHERDEVRQVIERTLVPAPGARWTTPSRPPVSGVRSVPPRRGSPPTTRDRLAQSRFRWPRWPKPVHTPSPRGGFRFHPRWRLRRPSQPAGFASRRLCSGTSLPRRRRGARPAIGRMRTWRRRSHSPPAHRLRRSSGTWTVWLCRPIR